MSNFFQSLSYVLDNEGRVYETYPETDQPTKWGIIAEDIAEFRGVPLSKISIEDVKNLSPEEIEKIYKAFYWDKIMGDEIINYSVATTIFDTAVNRGVSIGIKYAQRTLNLTGFSVVIDGQFGKETLRCINKCEPGIFVKTYESLVVAGYLGIIAAHPEDKRFQTGWMRRASRLLTLIPA